MTQVVILRKCLHTLLLDEFSQSQKCCLLYLLLSMLFMKLATVYTLSYILHV